jgi:hypothetical protein
MAALDAADRTIVYPVLRGADRGFGRAFRCGVDAEWQVPIHHTNSMMFGQKIDQLGMGMSAERALVVGELHQNDVAGTSVQAVRFGNELRPKSIQLATEPPAVDLRLHPTEHGATRTEHHEDRNRDHGQVQASVQDFAAPPRTVSAANALVMRIPQDYLLSYPATDASSVSRWRSIEVEALIP